MDWFQEGWFSVHPRLEDVVQVDRTYLIPVLYYSEVEWTELSSIYRNLPGHLGRGITPLTQGCPYWFGFEQSDKLGWEEEDDDTIYLTASVEPSGLQIMGRLRFDDWLAWTQAFDEQGRNLRRHEWVDTP